MSSKVSNQASGGRRTPLSLGPSSGPKSNQKSNSADSNPPDSTTIDRKHRKSIDEKLTSKLEKHDSPAKTSSAKDTSNNSTEKKEKTSKKDTVQNSHENGHSHADNKDEKLNAPKEENLKKTDKKVSRESPRIKDVLKLDAKENNKETDKTIKQTISTRSKSPDKEKDKRSTPIEKKEVQKKSNEDVQKEKNIKNDDEIKKAEINNKKKDQVELKKTTTVADEIVPLKRSSRAAALAQQTTKPGTNITGGSLALQTDFQGFEESTENEVEMESLLLDVEISESATTIPTAAKSNSPAHLSRSSIRNQINDEPKEKQYTSKSIRSVRKEMPMSPPKNLPAIDVPVTSTPDGKTFYTLAPSSLRQISGRRSLRPLKEYSFQYNSNYRESYRHINTELDCTNNTSMNVTVGSESAPQSESFISSFFSFGRGKKRALTPTPIISTTDEIQDDAVNTNTASPKRPRLDLSGLIGLVASPVTMLKNRLFRAKIDSSTPNNKTEDIDEVDVDIDGDGDEDGVENVSEIIVEEKKNLLEEEQQKKDAGTNDNDSVDLNDEDEEEESNESIEKEKSVEHLSKIEIGDEAIAGSNDDDEQVVNSNRRGRCDIM